ncbi:unnamed protein product [Closterium sp. NIES-54]
MPCLSPRRSAASARDSAVSTKPSPPSTDISLSGSSRSDSMAPGEIDYSQLPSDLDPSRLPRHVAIILDGNSQWATRRGLPKMLGHDAGGKSLRETVRLCGNWGIRALTVFAFSAENWGRPQVRTGQTMRFPGVTCTDVEGGECHVGMPCCDVRT